MVKVYHYFALWCIPCHVSEPTWLKFKSLHPEVEFLDIDVDKMPQFAEQYSVMSIPTFISVDETEKKRYTGIPKLEDLENLLV